MCLPKLKVLCLSVLVVQSVLASCNDWDQFGNVCYFVSEEPAIWADAVMKCYYYGSMSAEINSKEEHDFIVGLMKAKKIGVAWIGGQKNEVWEWVPRYKEISNGYTNWGQRQPDNYEEKEGCLTISKWFQYKWTDVPCESTYPFVCQKRAN